MRSSSPTSCATSVRTSSAVASTYRRRICVASGVDLTRRRATPEFVELMKFEIARCRELYASADMGVGMLPPQSARCIEAARVLYGRILDKIEAQQYDVFAKRATVSTAEKAAMVARLMRHRRA